MQVFRKVCEVESNQLQPAAAQASVTLADCNQLL
jgi:hypothetical protein